MFLKSLDEPGVMLGSHSGLELSADFTSSTPAAHVERTTGYDEEREQAWCRLEDSFGRFDWNLLTTDHSQWSAGREGTSTTSGGAVPVLGQDRGERWLGCGYSQPLVQAVRGSRLSVMEAFPLLRCLPRRAVRTWKSGLFAFALVCSGVWVLPVEYSVLDFSGDPACTSLGSTVDTCYTGDFGRISAFPTLR